MKRTLAIGLTAIMLCGIASCELPTATPSETSVSYGVASDASFWSAPTTEKILQDITNGYESVKTSATIEVLAAKGEYEAGQLIITAPAEKTLKYEVELNDLKTNGGDVFSKEKIELFHEKYIQVEVNQEGTTAPTGWYPDALVPYENIKACGENVVFPGQNQGLYFRFNVPIDQPHGEYVGNASVKIGGEEKLIPITLTVADVVVSEENHTKSIFSNGWFLERGELDTTQAMMDKYSEALFDYRLNPSQIITVSQSKDEEIDYFVEKAYEFMQNPRCSSLSLPFQTVSALAEDGKYYQSINEPIFVKYLTKVFEKSCETDFNMFDKLVCKLGTIDEPTTNASDRAKVKMVTETYDRVLSETADSLQANESYTSEIKDEIVESMRALKHIITTKYRDVYKDYIDTWCPLFRDYDSEYERSLYDNQEEKWWYGCIYPKSPYPTYHLEDTLLSARLESWMKAEYNVVGNLYWATDIYAQYDGYQYNDIEDYYGVVGRFPNVNGDGALFYPGKRYGVDGPIGSLRLEAIRDGIEEFEIFYAIKDMYTKASENVASVNDEEAFTATKLISSLTSNLYVGTKVGTTSALFSQARNTLFTMYQVTEQTGTYVVNYEDNGYGSIYYTLLAKEDTVIKKDGNAQTPIQTVMGADGVRYDKYRIEVKLDKDSNVAAFEIVNGEKSYNFEQILSGKATVRSAELMTENDVSAMGESNLSFELVDANSIDSAYSGTWAAVTLGTTFIDEEQTSFNTEMRQQFKIEGALTEGIRSGLNRLIMHVYYEGDDNVSFALVAKHKNNALLQELKTVELHKGMNEIVISLTPINWANLGEITYFRITLADNESGQPQRTVYIADTVIYAK